MTRRSVSTPDPPTDREAPAPGSGRGPGDEPPPFLGSWGRVYALVVVGLLVMIALCAWLSRLGR